MVNSRQLSIKPITETVESDAKKHEKAPCKKGKIKKTHC